MLVIPAIDLKDGRCVRLRQGNMRDETVYSDDPVATALHWQGLGAPHLHIVDLNGAVDGRPRNWSCIEAIVKAVSIPVQVGGGIRTFESVERYLSLGVGRIVLGTTAIHDQDLLRQSCERYPERIAVAIDARDGKVAVRGWTDAAEISVRDMAVGLAGRPLAAVIYTDIATDGMLQGPNLPALRDVLVWSPVPVIASGGISSLEDIRAIRSLDARIQGVIIGKALYDGKLDLRAALDAASNGSVC